MTVAGAARRSAGIERRAGSADTDARRAEVVVHRAQTELAAAGCVQHLDGASDADRLGEPNVRVAGVKVAEGPQVEATVQTRDPHLAVRNRRRRRAGGIHVPILFLSPRIQVVSGELYGFGVLEADVGVIQHREAGVVVLVRIGLPEADAVLEPERVLFVDVVVDVQRFTGVVNAAEQVGVVFARVVLAGGTVLVGERAHSPSEAHVFVAEIRSQIDVAVGNAELSRRVAVGRVREVVALDRDRALGPSVAERQVKLGPVRLVVRVALPAQVLIVRNDRRVERGLALARQRAVALADAHAHRSADVAVVLELPAFVVGGGGRAAVRGERWSGSGGGFGARRSRLFDGWRWKRGGGRLGLRALRLRGRRFLLQFDLVRRTSARFGLLCGDWQSEQNGEETGKNQGEFAHLASFLRRDVVGLGGGTSGELVRPPVSVYQT